MNNDTVNNPRPSFSPKLMDRIWNFTDKIHTSSWAIKETQTTDEKSEDSESLVVDVVKVDDSELTDNNEYNFSNDSKDFKINLKQTTKVESKLLKDKFEIFDISDHKSSSDDSDKDSTYKPTLKKSSSNLHLKNNAVNLKSVITLIEDKGEEIGNFNTDISFNLNEILPLFICPLCKGIII